MTAPFLPPVKFDLLKVGHCQHPECIALRGGGRRAIDFPALVGLIEHPRHGLILYDTGYSRHFNEATRRFPECLYRIITPVSLPPEEELLAQLEARGIRADDIGIVIISHFHADHIAGLRDFPRSRFIATRKERSLREKAGRLGRLQRAYLRDLLPADFDSRVCHAEDQPAVPLPTGWRPFESGRDLLGDASLLGLDLPGHTASQLGLAFHAGHLGEVFLVGDACWKIEGLDQDRRPSRIAYRLFDDSTDYDDTFGRLVQLQAAATAPRIIPSHCAQTWDQLGGTTHVLRE
ncbi:MBL fold metallo-hydrolase [Luteolibacter marinus]|uniref:MBL fold metallo-hydrolase n=1 Tax=Luteolibacter marinus TaxID=2776705 RepID=UPI0018672AC1|nr:MBL fold metallo-hydrolase [Luteolibacter marinus]